jgi:type I restriction enzyme R subunit
VFLRQVKSRILFEQMLGRGTRKGEHFADKSHFTVFDCFNGTLFDYFRTATAITAEPPDKPTRTIKEVIEDIWANRDRDYNIRCLAKRLQRIDKEMAGEERERFAAFGVAGGDLGRYARELTANLRRDFTGTMKLLLDADFQDLLVNYQRPARSFIKAETYEDQVSSKRLVRGVDGREYKPEDYLDAFAKFVRENRAKVEAIRILLNRPQGWGTQALGELKEKLMTAPERFTMETLERAHRLRYDKALVDIISMVKHASREEEPLLTAEERVARAFDRLTRGQEFTLEQQRWLGRIRHHLVANLSIDQEDFGNVPVLHSAGGWGNADRAFKGKLLPFLGAINEAVAA